MSRPKKLILVVCPDKTDLSIKMFVLSVHGFVVMGVTSKEEFDHFWTEGSVDAIWFTSEAVRRCCAPQILEVAPFLTTCQGLWTMEDIVGELRVLSQGRRGPKPARQGCAIPGCPNRHRAHGLCWTHYDAARYASLKHSALVQKKIPQKCGSAAY